jgi:hypothetical protein
MNRFYERVWVVEIAFGKTPKIVQDRHVKLSLTRGCTGMGLEKAYGLVARCIPVILLAPLEPDFSVAYGKGGRGHTQELVDLQVVPSSGRS